MSMFLSHLKRREQKIPRLNMLQRKDRIHALVKPRLPETSQLTGELIIDEFVRKNAKRYHVFLRNLSGS